MADNAIMSLLMLSNGQVWCLTPAGTSIDNI